MAVFDATALIHLLEPDAPAIIDPATKEPVPDAKVRFDHLVETLEQQRERIIIPTPALSEVLMHANDAMASYLEVLNNSSRFRIVPFDQRAAIELANIIRESLSGKGLQVGAGGTRASLKFDRQLLHRPRTGRGYDLFGRWRYVQNGRTTGLRRNSNLRSSSSSGRTAAPVLTGAAPSTRSSGKHDICRHQPPIPQHGHELLHRCFRTADRRTR